ALSSLTEGIPHALEHSGECTRTTDCALNKFGPEYSNLPVNQRSIFIQYSVTCTHNY
ncbi:unnamed protein product, partial [Hymenolepis diminuta]